MKMNRKNSVQAVVFACTAFLLTALPALGQISEQELAKVRAIEQARIAVIQKVYGSVVAIYGKTRRGGGSGVLYDPAGYALTNYHVVRGAGIEGLAGLADGKLYKWKLIGLDPGGDLAIIKLEGRDKFPYSDLGDSDTVRVGDFAMAMGNPFVLADDQKPTVTLGVVSGINRYQPGTGPNGTLLVYGNCIQIDSSINPGNSGGPLFNMRGQVVGINGRGSFEERGRVNVGVGYAIGINQAKNFLPDMLATKVALHATLDATFAHRRDYGGHAVCTAIDLDSKAAQNGLRLGDRLVRFGGRAINNANEFTNHLSTLPAGWPVEVVYERNGKQYAFWQLLDDLPYPKAPQRSRPAPQPKKEQPEAPSEKNKGEDKRSGPKPRNPGQQRVAAPTGEPGKIRDAKLNRNEAIRVLRQWVEFQGGFDALKGIKVTRFQFDMRAPNGTLLGQTRMIASSDGRFRMDSRRPNAAKDVYEPSAVWDGQTHWRDQDGKGKITKGRNARTERDIAIGHILALVRHKKDFDSQFKTIELQGSDSVMQLATYRILIEDKIGNRVLLWFSVADRFGQLQSRLLKTAMADEDGKSRGPMTVYGDYRLVDGVRMAHRLQVVEGIAERPLVDVMVKGIEVLDEIPEEAFAIPKKAIRN